MADTNKGLDRRKFLAASISGVVTAGLTGLSPHDAIGQDSSKSQDDAKKDIIYRQLGKTGMKIPIVSMGVGAVAHPELIQAAYEKGIRHFDTAANYQYGRNEQMVGNVIQKLGVRDEVVIATKGFIPRQRQALKPENAKQQIESLMDGSLKRLKTDYVDILYLHDVSNPLEVNDPMLIEGLHYLKEKKKVRAIGISTHANMADVIEEAVDGGNYDVVLTAINFTMADDERLLKAIENAASKGIGFVAMKTLAGGSRWPNPESRHNYSNSTIIKAAMKWVMRNKNITTCIPGFESYDHLNEDFAIATDLEYNPEEKQLLEDNNIVLSLGFCRQCRQCLATCPHNVDIPTLMRTYMYAAQYADFYLARETLKSIPKENGLNPCKDCSSCIAQCANSVDIPFKIGELKLMYA